MQQDREPIHGLIGAWLIPAVPPPVWRCALATLIAVSAAILMRIALLGLSGTIGATQPFFPAMVLVTLYAGWRWGLVPIACGAAFGWWLWGGRHGEPLSEDEIATMVIFLISALVTTGVAEGLRGAAHSLARARVQQQEAEVRLDVVQTGYEQVSAP